MTIYRGSAHVPGAPAGSTVTAPGKVIGPGRRMLIRLSLRVPDTLRAGRGGRAGSTLRVRLAVTNALALALVVFVLLLTTTLVDGRPHIVVDVLTAAVIGIAALMAGYLVLTRMLRPLRRVTTTARRLSGERMDERIRYTGPDDEVAELAATFDDMLDRLADSFETQRRFVANASHELRTPLAVMRTEIDVTLSDPDVDVAELRRMATVVRDASERANSLVDALLVLARSEAQAGRRLVRKVPADLSCGVAMALTAAKRDIDRLGLDVITELEPAAVVGDPSLLDRLAGNLIENAVRYNHGNGRLWVRTDSDDTVARLIVGNTGFELTATDMPKLFEPFRRGGRDRTGSGRGSGLGLSIVRAVCDAHGGSLAAVPQPGGGLEVTVTLPAAATTPVDDL